MQVWLFQRSWLSITVQELNERFSGTKPVRDSTEGCIGDSDRWFHEHKSKSFYLLIVED